MHPRPAHQTKPAIKPARKSGWSDERRARHAAAIRRWKPWERSTGPRSESGKARVARNAYKHGLRATAARLMAEGLAAQKAFVRFGLQLGGVPYENNTNKLLKAWRTRLLTLDRIFHVRMYQGAVEAEMEDHYAKTLLFRRA